MPFDLEDKIRYENLAPSLQAMLGINKYNTMIEDIIGNGDNGQLIKIGKDKTIFADDNMYLIRAVNSEDDINTLKAIGPIDLKEVFNTWNRVSSYGYGLANQNSNVGDQQAARKAYSYNDNNRSIYMNINPNCTSGFISDRLYSKFWIHVRMHGLTDYYGGSSDDDANIFLLAYMVDKSNLFHDISAVRVGGRDNQWGDDTFFLAYDFVARGGWMIKPVGTAPTGFKYLAKTQCPKIGWTGFVDFYAEKNGGTIIGRTANQNQTTFNSAYDISYTLPNDKPAGWSDEDWYNLKYMMLQPCPVGFGVQSQNSRFEIIAQKEVFEEDSIYDLEGDAVYAYINGQWVKIGKASDILPHKVWLYNNVLNYLYWYDSPGKYIKIESNMISNIKGALEGQLPKMMNDGTIEMHDNFAKLAVVDNDVDFAHQKILSDNDIYRLDIHKKYVKDLLTGVWNEEEIGLNDILNETYIYNSDLHRFFLYTKPNDYKRIVLSKCETII